MYYIYTLENDRGQVYVGCTTNPLRRMYEHNSKSYNRTMSVKLGSHTFYLRHQFECKYEARNKEQKLINKLNSVNMKAASLINTSDNVVILSTELRHATHRKFKPYKPKLYIITGNDGSPYVSYKGDWLKFDSVAEAQAFVDY